MRVHYVFNVDTVGSSKIPFNNHERSRFYRALEGCFHYCLRCVGSSDEFCSWAGEGGFALFDSEDFSAEDALLSAEHFLNYASVLINESTVGVDSLPEIQYRVVLGATPIATTGRLSTYAGWGLNVILKNEREFGEPGKIVAIDGFFKNLGTDKKSRFLKYKDLTIDGESYKTYHYKAEENESDDANAYMLTLKNDIDRSTVSELTKGLIAAEVEKESKVPLEKVLVNAFAHKDLPDLIVEKIHFFLTLHLSRSKQENFRVSYLRPKNDKRRALQVTHSHALESRNKKEMREVIPIRNAYTAGRAWSENKVTYVTNVIAELEKISDDDDRRFTLLKDQQKGSIGSIVCIPISVESADPMAAKSEDLKEEPIGVLSIDTPEPEFFDKPTVESLKDMLSPLVIELITHQRFIDILNAYDCKI